MQDHLECNYQQEHDQKHNSEGSDKWQVLLCTRTQLQSGKWKEHLCTFLEPVCKNQSEIKKSTMWSGAAATPLLENEEEEKKCIRNG